MDNEKPVTAIPTEPVFHYTNQAGLLGIIRERKIWATDILYLNDTAEMRYSIEMLEGHIQNLAKLETPEYLRALDFVHRLSKDFGLGLSGTYVTCFSEHGDKLSQWRGYCSGECGFSLGFNLSKLETQMQEQEFRPAKCTYTASEQETAIQALLQVTLMRLHEWASRNPEKEFFIATEVWTDTLFQFLGIAAQFKHPNFSEEREWRLISLQGPETAHLRSRPGKSMIIPYIEFDLGGDEGLSSLEKIWIGPSPFPSESRRSVESLLRVNNIRSVEVVCSPTPYRSW